MVGDHTAAQQQREQNRARVVALRALRADGASWAQVADQLGISEAEAVGMSGDFNEMRTWRLEHPVEHAAHRDAELRHCREARPRWSNALDDLMAKLPPRADGQPAGWLAHIISALGSTVVIVICASMVAAMALALLAAGIRALFPGFL